MSFNKTIDDFSFRWTLIYQPLGFGEHHFLGVDKSQCPPYEKSLIVYYYSSLILHCTFYPFFVPWSITPHSTECLFKVYKCTEKFLFLQKSYNISVIWRWISFFYKTYSYPTIPDYPSCDFWFLPRLKGEDTIPFVLIQIYMKVKILLVMNVFVHVVIQYKLTESVLKKNEYKF
jgi:hypothetical protein